MNYKHLNILLTLISLCLLMVSVSLFKQALSADLQQYREDMKCVSVLVSQGIERKDITVVGGTCVVEEDIYYKSINL